MTAPAGESRPLPPWVLPAGLGLTLAVLVCVAFSPALVADFVRFDDPVFVVDNPRVHGLTPDNLAWMLTGSLGGHWHPLTWLSWAIDYELWGGLEPAGFHLTNLVLHAAGALVLYGLSVRLLGLAVPGASRRGRHAAGFFAAALFAVHPLRVESVVWITERRDVLSAAFLFAAAWAYVACVRTGGPGVASRRLYAACIGLLALSLLSKAWGMSFFALMLLLDWYPLRRLPMSPRAWRGADVRAVLIEKVPMLALGVLAAALAASAQTGAFAAKTLAEWSVAERTAQAGYGLVFYLWKSIAPTGLSPLYELPEGVSPAAMPYAACLAAVGVAFVAVLALARRFPALAVASASYVILLAPVLGVFQSGEQFVADRYSHLATVGFAVTLAGAGLMLSQRARGTLSPAWGVALPALVVFALSALTFAQSAVWRNTLSLWTHAASVTPTPLVRFALAEELAHQGRRDDARAQLELVAAGGGRTGGRAWYILGEELKSEGRFAEAADAYARAAPLMEQAFMAHVQLGSLYLGPLSRPDDAVAQFRLAVADVERGGRRPVSGLPFLALGDALRRTGDTPGARAAFTRALEFPDARPDAERELRGLDERPKTPQ